MLVSLLAKMLHILVLCPVLLISCVQTLTIDSQLGTSVEDCFDRISIGEQLPASAIYRNVSELTTRECEQICKQDKQCQAYDYGVGAKGNATCDLSTQSEKDVKENSILIRHPDYDVYVRRFQCEQSPPSPIQPLLDDPEGDGPNSNDRPQHRPVFRPDVDERPLTDDYLVSGDIDPYNSGSKPISQYRPDDISQKPAYDVGPSYGDHKPQDITYGERPNDPYRPVPNSPYRPGQNDPYRPERPSLQDQYRPNRPERPQDPYRPNDPYPKPKPELNDVLHFDGYGKPRPDPDPYRPEKPNYNYIIRPNRRPRPEGEFMKPTKPLDHLNSPVGPPYRPNRPENPTYNYNSQYASNYGQNQNDNSVYVEIYDPPRPYIPIKDRPIQQNYDQGFLGYGTYSSQNSYSQNSQSQNSYTGTITELGYDQNHNKPYVKPDEKPGYGNKPITGSNDKGSYGYGQSDYNSQDGYGFNNNKRPSHNQRPNDRYKPQGNQNYNGGNQLSYNQAYGSSQSEHSQSSYGSYAENHRPYSPDNSESGYQNSKPTYNKPSYSGDKGDYGSNQGSYGSNQGYGSSQGYYGTKGQSSSQSTYGSTQGSHGQGSYGESSYGGQDYDNFYGNQGSYGGSQGSYSSGGSYGGNKGSYGSYGSNQGSYGGSQSSYGAGQGSYGSAYGQSSNGYGNRPVYDYETHKPGYGNERPDSGYDSTKPDYEQKPGYGSQKPAYDTKPSYGNNRPDPAYDSTKPDYDMKPSYGNDRPDPVYGNTKPYYDQTPGYGSQKPGYDMKPSYGNDHPDPAYGSTKPDYDMKPSYGNVRPDPVYGNTKPDYDQKPGYGSQKPNYDMKPSYGSDRPDPTYGSTKPGSGYGSPKPDIGYGKPSYNTDKFDYVTRKPSYENQKPEISGYGPSTDRPSIKPVYEYELDKPSNVPAYIVRPGGEVVTSRPVVIGDYERPVYKEPGSFAACFRRVLAGRRALRSFVRKVVPCERLEDCRRECALEKRFHCESFNYRLDQSFRGKGLCELMTKPIEAFDQHRDFVDDKNYDFYEVDRNSLEPNCPETLRGPGLLHSGFLSSKPDRVDIRPDRDQRPNRLDQRLDRFDQRPDRFDQRPDRFDQRPDRFDQRPNRVDHHQSGWRDRHDWAGGYRDRFSFDDRRVLGQGQENRRFEEHYVPYQIGQSRTTDEQDSSWGQYGGNYGGLYYKDRNDYHKSINHWGLTSDRPTGVKPYFESRKSHGFDYHSLGKNLDFDLTQNDFHDIRIDKGSRYGYGAWKRGRWNTGNTLDSGYEGVERRDEGSDEPISLRGGNENECYSRRRPGMSLTSGAIRRSLIARNVVECEAACFGEREFKCVSYSYRYSTSRGTDNCFLSERPYRGLEMSADSGSDVYGMPQDKGCAVASNRPWVESECFWHVRSDTAVSGSAVRATLTVAGLGACEAECIRAQGFFCRGFSYRFDAPTIGDEDINNCILTSSPTTRLARTDTSGHELYARGNYGRGCEPAVYDDTQNGECYLQYDKAAKLTGVAIRGQARVKDEQTCGTACTEAPFRCLSFSFNNNAPPSTDNCLLSEIRLFDLQRGVDYVHSADDWLFAFDLFNSKCWRKVHREDHSSELPHPITPPEEHFHGSSPSLPSGPGYPDTPGKVSHNTYQIPAHPAAQAPLVQVPSLAQVAQMAQAAQVAQMALTNHSSQSPNHTDQHTKPDHLAQTEPIQSKHTNRQTHTNLALDQIQRYTDHPTQIALILDHLKLLYHINQNIPTRNLTGLGLTQNQDLVLTQNLVIYQRDLLDQLRYTRNLVLGRWIDLIDQGICQKVLGGHKNLCSRGIKIMDQVSELEASWRHYTVSGFPCRAGTTCAQNQIVGHWACEPEGGEIGSWDYCCAPTHRCGYSEGFNKPWCYVGHNEDQWRPCSEKYYPYHHHNIPHPSQGHRDTPRPRPWRDTPQSPWPVKPITPPPPDYIPHWDKPPGPYLSEADRKYWDDLYEDGPKAYYDKYGNPLPGYSRVPTEDRPYIRYKHNNRPPSSGQWVPVSDGLPTVPGLGAPRYWPVAYLHRGPPPNMTYYRYNETNHPGHTTTPTSDRAEARVDDGISLDDDDDRPHSRSNGHTGGRGDDYRGNNERSDDNYSNRRGNDRRNNDSSRDNDNSRDYSNSRNNDRSRSNDDRSTDNDGTRDYSDSRNNDRSGSNNDSSRSDDSFRSNDKPNGKRDEETNRDEKKINDSKSDEMFNANVDKTTAKSITTEVPTEKVNSSDVELVKTEKVKTMDSLKGIDDKLDDFSKSIEVFDIEDAKSEKLSDVKTLEAEERQIEAIGRLLASRRGSKIVLEKRSQDLDTKNIAIDKDTIDYNFGNRFQTERRGIVKRISKDEIERDRADKSLEVSETTFVRPPRVLSTTDNIRKAIVNGKVFYDATIREQRQLFNNNTRKAKNLRRTENSTPSIINNNNFGRKKIIKTRNANPVRRVKRVFRKRYNPDEVRRRLLERDRSKNNTEKL